MTNLCGHKRDALRKALEFANASNIDDVSRGWPRPDGGVGALLFDVHDPAKLAEMLAERGRELGLPCDTDFPATSCIEEDPTLVWRAGDVGVVLVCDDSIREFAMPQARTILLQWLQLPDGAREEAERVLRGET